MKKYIIYICIFFFVMPTVYSQHYAQTEQLNVEVEKKEKKKVDKYISLSFYTGFSHSLFNKTYLIESDYDKVKMTADSKFGSLLGGHLLFQLGKAYGLGFEPVFSSERYEVDGGMLKNKNFGFGILHEIKLNKSTSVLIGNQLHFMRSDISASALSNFNLNIGLSYTTTKGMYFAASYRKSLVGNGYGEEVIKVYEGSNGLTEKWSNASAFQLSIGYKFKFKRKPKKAKPVESNEIQQVNPNYYLSENTQDNKEIYQQRQSEKVDEVESVDYSEKSIDELKKLQQEAISVDDYDRASLIEQEIAKQKSKADIKELSIEELEKLLEKAIEQEDYEAAELIQNEIEFKKVSSINSLEELIRLQEEAIKNEDYEKAAELQEEIEKRNTK